MSSIRCTFRELYNGPRPSRFNRSALKVFLSPLSIEPSSTTTAWMFGLDSVESKDAAKYTCSITVGNDQLSMVNHLTVIRE